MQTFKEIAEEIEKKIQTNFETDIFRWNWKDEIRDKLIYGKIEFSWLINSLWEQGRQSILLYRKIDLILKSNNSIIAENKKLKAALESRIYQNTPTPDNSIENYLTIKGIESLTNKFRELNSKKDEKPIDKVFIKNLDFCLRYFGIFIEGPGLDKIIDIFELIQEKGNHVTLIDLENLKKKHNAN